MGFPPPPVPRADGRGPARPRAGRDTPARGCARRRHGDCGGGGVGGGGGGGRDGGGPRAARATLAHGRWRRWRRRRRFGRLAARVPLRGDRAVEIPTVAPDV